MFDSKLESQVIKYNQYLKRCFKTNTPVRLQNKEYERILNARYEKISRIKRRFVYLIQNYTYIYFCTFTFDNDLIKKCDRTKKDCIKSSLHSFDSDIKFILNVDYGDKTEREHYHALVGTHSPLSLRQHLKDTYPCRTGCEFVDIHTDDIKRLSKYINKLSNHCVKDSTKRKRIYFNFKGYDVFKPPLNRIMYILDSDNLGL